jgi:hypothetical protein
MSAIFRLDRAREALFDVRGRRFDAAQRVWQDASIAPSVMRVRAPTSPR